MKFSFATTSVGPLLTVQTPLTSHLTPKYLQSLPQSVQWKCLYKRLYKLRHFIPQNSRLAYCLLLRTRFSHHDVELRRRLFLELETPITSSEWVRRLANTYAFVFNATCNPTDTPPHVNFYEEWRNATKPRIETSILLSVLRMHSEMRNESLHRDYGWVNETRVFYDSVIKAVEEAKQKEINRLHNLKKLHFLVFFQHEKTLASLNESMHLCL
ncbi:hypothetical protein METBISCDRAFT_26084 [Metschnikowia bicuspidata]|uniref:Uncharacterized protein n=1 Tax=Metschnikowia bicuspidata TaxID=27322 RepID=A0A4P9ZHZ5_9ASCO|nr:hypothetical protein METBISCDRAFT_26084 [Metschnikowia bicuspidata]